jgi:hypothetical protein
MTRPIACRTLARNTPGIVDMPAACTGRFTDVPRRRCGRYRSRRSGEVAAGAAIVRYSCCDLMHTATSGVSEVLAFPHEADRSSAKIAGFLDGPQYAFSNT